MPRLPAWLCVLVLSVALAAVLTGRDGFAQQASQEGGPKVWVTVPGVTCPI